MQRLKVELREFEAVQARAAVERANHDITCCLHWQERSLLEGKVTRLTKFGHLAFFGLRLTCRSKIGR